MRPLVMGGYLPGKTVIHRLDPRTKLLWGLVMVLVPLLVSRLPSLMLAAAGVIAAALAARMNIRMLLTGIKWLWLVVLFTALVQSVSLEGTVLVRLFGLEVTAEGLTRGAGTFLRIFILYLSCTVLTMTTPPLKLAAGLEAVLSPLNFLKIPVGKIAMLISIAMRCVPTILEEGESIRCAQQSRGAPFGSKKKYVRLKANLALFVPLIVASLQRAGDLAAAMESRCYTGGVRHCRGLQFAFADRIAIFLLAAFGLILALMGAAG